jgi:hypothetical protein
MNKDGTLTPAGKKRYNKELEKVRKEEQVLKNRAATQAKLDRLNTRKQNVSNKKKQMDEDDSISTLGKKKTNNTSEAPKKRTVKDVPDDELRARVNRLQLENTYKQLATQNVSDVNKKNTSEGKAFIKEVLKNSGKNVATQFATYAMGTAVNKTFKGVFNDDAIVNPKKGQKDK